MGLAQRAGGIPAEIEEVEPRRARGRGHLAEAHPVRLHPIHGEPAIDMQPFAFAEPLLAQLRVSLFDDIDIGEGHIVDLDPGPGMAPAKHEHVQHLRLPAWPI
ncbi:hypothetical protein D3C81_2124920 [compost metagenome]